MNGKRIIGILLIIGMAVCLFDFLSRIRLRAQAFKFGGVFEGMVSDEKLYWLNSEGLFRYDPNSGKIKRLGYGDIGKKADDGSILFPLEDGNFLYWQYDSQADRTERFCYDNGSELQITLSRASGHLSITDGVGTSTELSEPGASGVTAFCCDGKWLFTFCPGNGGCLYARTIEKNESGWAISDAKRLN